MQDDFASLFAFNRWANAKMLDACRKLTPEPGWPSVRSTVVYLALVTEGQEQVKNSRACASGLCPDS